MSPLEEMTDEELTSLIERLTAYARRKLMKLSWRGVPFRRGMAVAKGYGPHDLAAEAVESLLDGSRTWNPQTEPSLENFLRGVIDSKVSHLVNCVEHRSTKEPTSDPPDAPPREALVEAAEPRPDDLVADAEWRKAFRCALYESLEDDRAAAELFDCLSAGFTRSECAEYLSLEPKEVDYARKRLYRKISQVSTELQRSLER